MWAKVSAAGTGRTAGNFLVSANAALLILVDILAWARLQQETWIKPQRDDANQTIAIANNISSLRNTTWFEKRFKLIFITKSNGLNNFACSCFQLKQHAFRF